MIMPPSVEVAFSYNDSVIKTIPLFLLMLLIRHTDSNTKSEVEYWYLDGDPSDLCRGRGSDLFIDIFKGI